MSGSFTSKELARHDGKDGNPAYVAAEGNVYDVSKSRLWKNGAHMGRHTAGRDLTAEIASAPHGDEVFARGDITKVGTLTGDADTHLPRFVRTLLDVLPMARRHLHPITVHFPTAYFIAAALFTLIHILRPQWLGLDFEAMGMVMLVLGILFTPVTIATGLFTWWVNYSLTVTPLIARKIIFSGTLVLAEVAFCILKLGGFTEHAAADWVCRGLIFCFAVNVVILGHYGGEIVFPTKRRPRRSPSQDEET